MAVYPTLAVRNLCYELFVDSIDRFVYVNGAEFIKRSKHFTGRDG